MSWAKIDDHANEFHKQLAAGPEACWFWVCGLMFANRQRERDGFIPEAVISMLYPVKSPKRLANKLIEVGLWDEAPGGYQIHNYHGWNPTPEQVEAERAAGRERAAKSYAKKHPKKSEPSPEEKPKTPSEEEPKKTDSSGSTPLHSDSTPGEEEIPPPPSDEEAEPDSAVVAKLRKHGESFERSFGKQPAHQRADVLELHAEWRKQFGRGNVALVVGSNHDDANALADAIDAHTLANCLFVARHAKFDGMVSGRVDEQKNPHESIRYIFGTPETFSRILRDGTKRERDASGQSALARMRDLKSRDAGEA